MAKKSRASYSFSGRVNRSIEHEKERFASSSYLNIPKGVKMLKIEDRKYYLDFIPYTVTCNNHPDLIPEEGQAEEGGLWWRRPFQIHRNIGPNDESVICPRSVGKPCPICEFYMKRRDEDASSDELSALRAKSRYLYAVVPIGHKKLDEEIMVWDYSWKLFQKQLEDELENDPSNDRFPGLEDGLTLEIRFREEKLGSMSYYDTARINFHKRDEVYSEEILDEVPDLDGMLKVMTYNELKSLFFDHDVEDEEQEDSEEAQEQEEDDSGGVPPRKQQSSFKHPKKNSNADEGEKSQLSRRKKQKKEDVCPHGFEFGVDTDTYEECRDCEIWDRCAEAKDKNKNEQ